MVERDTEGLSWGQPEDKHGIRASNTASVNFDDVLVPADRLIGDVEGQGLLQAQAVFGYTRLMVAAFGLGGGWACLDRAIPYSTERIQAGSPLSEKQGYTHKLIVPHVARLEAARAYIEETAERIDGGEGSLNTEGAIAKYFASEAGNAAAEAAIQALGGYGYTREYMVEKVKRDVRITTIYEGTSEILEMTIARDRWQEHLKTSGGYYHQLAAELERLHAEHPDVGAGVAALALGALGVILERARLGRLTRNQHVLFRLGELIAWAECAASLARRAARAAGDGLPEKTDRRFGAPALAAISRVFARDAALRVGSEGLRWICGDTDSRELEQSIGLSAIYAAQAGGLADMDRVADLLYGRQLREPCARWKPERSPSSVSGPSCRTRRTSPTFWTNCKAGPLQHQRGAARALGPRALLGSRPQGARQDVLEDRRLGARLGVGAPQMEAAAAAQGRRRHGPDPEAGGGGRPAGPAGLRPPRARPGRPAHRRDPGQRHGR